jgi:hypothetical protein
MGRGFCWGDRSMEKGVNPMAVKYQSSLSQVSESCSGLKASGCRLFVNGAIGALHAKRLRCFKALSGAVGVF